MESKMPKVIYRGAESVIYLDDGNVVKERARKSYRIPEIDEKLRRERTRKEVRLLVDARALGVMTPKIIETGETKITMKHIDGKRVKELLDTSDRSTIARTCREIGRLVGRLHSNNIVHGDLTTSNMISTGRDIYFIDFSLGDTSRKIEDKGVDMKLLHEALESTHFKILKTCWDNIIKGYKAEYKDAVKVLEKVDEIERRARYSGKE
ncbi:Kae1-associated serine/threonine protein kinase [archaeon]|nr:MAG: Kae1-associated serine/threonine protein kinase [archaeon]